MMELMSDDNLILLKLYEEDVINFLCGHHDVLERFSPLAEYGLLESLKKQHAYEWSEIVVGFWQRLMVSVTARALMSRVLEVMDEGSSLEEQQLKKELLEVINRKRSVFYTQLIRHCLDLLKVIDGHALQNYLSNSKEFIEVLEQANAVSVPDKLLWKKIVIRRTLMLRQHLQLQFLDAIIKTCSDNRAQSVVEQIDRNFVANYKYSQYCEENGVGKGNMRICRPDIAVAEFLNSEVNDKAKNIFSSQFSDILSSKTGSISGTSELHLRKYQLELLESACVGQNTLVFAPTGSGKTIVSAYIIKKHFENAQQRTAETSLTRKACFLVPNTIILEQQANTFRTFLPESISITFVERSAKRKLPVRNEIEIADVVVITPQLILNLLSETSNSAMIGPFSLSTFTLMIFDECHHASLSHPYNEIMKKYHDLKKVGGHELPQIIGLTASLGVGDSETFLDVVNHLLGICANLDTSHLAVVERYKEELEQFTSTAVCRIDYYQPTYEVEDFYKYVLELVSTFESYILTCDSSEVKELVDTNMKIPGDKNSQAYEQWLYEMKFQKVPCLIRESNVLSFVTECLEFIEVFYKSIRLCTDFPPLLAQNYLKEKLVPLLNFSSTQSRNAITSSGILKLDVSTSKNQLFEALQRRLVEEFTSQPDGRILIFVTSREIANRLAKFLDGFTPLLNLNVRTGVILGLNASNANTQCFQVQQTTLKKFADGTLKVLCATSVGEEGIDIQKCTVVINYNYVSNDIADIQKRGRARAKEAKYVLMTNNASLMEREKKNINREILMNEGLKYIRAKPKNWFFHQVKNLIEKNNADRELITLTSGQQTGVNGVFKLLCRKCATPICLSTDVATDPLRSQYFVVRPEFWKLTVNEQYSAEKKEMEKFNEIAGVGTHRCGKANCGHSWGRIVISKSVLIPILKAEAFSLERTTVSNGTENIQRMVFRKWKQVLKHCFVPRVITTYDYVIMSKETPPGFTL